MLLPQILSPEQATSGLRRLRPTDTQLTDFRGQLAEMLRHLDPTKIERHGETHILDFLRVVSKPGEGGSRYGNVHGKRDLVLHLGETADSPVAVVLEVKGPKNPVEMLAPDDLNRKALHQLLLYYLEDRSDEKADDFRRLIVTTGYEWYIFDAIDFNRLFWKDKSFVKAFRDWKAGAKASPNTDFFYKSIAGKQLAALDGELRVAYVDLRPGLPTKPAELLFLYRLFHPAYLLKEPLTGRRDPNTLNQEFYNELLYLMGLKEEKRGGLRRIGRCPEGERQPGSLLENTLRKLHTGHGLNNMTTAERMPYGDTLEVQLEEVALALCLMWVNRLLFLKLLEGQLVRYHAPEAAGHFRFLQPAKLTDYDEVLTLFFEVLNRAPADRSPDVVTAFPEVPYLNSSLFEPSTLEGHTFDISGLRDGLGLAPFPGSVLRKVGAPAVPTAKAHTAAFTQWAALPYLLYFLDAYDFATDPTTSHAPTELTTTDAPRPLLSAAVLGLVFEKINGYRDGSFYTPGFVTMYMARQTLGRAVVRHFTRAKAFPELAGCDTLDELQDAVAPAKRPRRAEYATYFNTLTVLDPAVGSGHFLVSALNELLALKSRLGLLLDDEGARLPYTLEVEHDELLVTDMDGLPAPYRVATFTPENGQRTVGPERTRLQKALFREKRALMEHALFGVDINPNSVRICRLRLWIELLKHAYYKPETGFRELETLPNLDLNVKTGNSLLARFALDADLSEVFRQGKFSLKTYRAAVHEYFGSRGRDEKNTLLGFFQQIKQQFTAVLHKKDKKREALRLARNQRLVLETQVLLIPETASEETLRLAKMDKLQEEADKLDTEIQAHEQGVLFREAFEWRFEFPEVLDEAGTFRGFDVVIGNPPYIRHEEFTALKPYFKDRFATFNSTADLYVYFIELGLELVAPGGELSFITGNKWLTASYGGPFRNWLQNTYELVEFINFGDLFVFPQTKAYPAILSINRIAPTLISSFRAAAIPKLPPPTLDELIATHVRTVSQNMLAIDSWSLADDSGQEIITKLKSAGKTLGEYVELKIYSGVKTGFNAAFIINSATRDKLISEDSRSADVLKPYLVGRDVKNYSPLASEKYLLLLPSGWTRQKLGWKKDKRGLYTEAPVAEAYNSGWEALSANYPAIAAHLLPFEKTAAARSDQGNFWWELRACDYYGRYEEPKIVFPDIASRNQFTIDENGFYLDMTAFFIPADDKFLLGVLNSKTVLDYFHTISPIIRSGFLRWKRQYLEQIPIPTATPEQQVAIATQVQQILDAKAADPAANTAKLEADVDAAVAMLYGVALPAGSAV